MSEFKEKLRVWEIQYQTPGNIVKTVIWKGSLLDWLASMPRQTLIVGDPKEVTDKVTTVGEIADRIIAVSKGSE